MSINTTISRIGFSLVWACLVLTGIAGFGAATIALAMGTSVAFNISPPAAYICILVGMIFAGAFYCAWEASKD